MIVNACFSIVILTCAARCKSTAAWVTSSTILKTPATKAPHHSSRQGLLLSSVTSSTSFASMTTIIAISRKIQPEQTSSNVNMQPEYLTRVINTAIKETSNRKEDKPTTSVPFSNPHPTPRVRNRRDALLQSCMTIGGIVLSSASILGAIPDVAVAYTPDPDKLKESLYLVSRVQEATVQQERLVSKSKLQEDLKRKMKLSLRLVDKSYRLLDQINYLSNFVEPRDEVVIATEAGYNAAEALQSAIDYVNNDGLKDTADGGGPITEEQKEFLTDAMKTTRQELFVFLKYMPADKIREARLRVETENVDNREEFDGDSDAGVYNPVVLPWKQQ